MSDTEQLQILNMVESGQVSVNDAIELMSSTTQESAWPESADDQRWLRVRVTDVGTGNRKVSVNIPLGWMKWGLMLGSRFAPELEEVDVDGVMTDLDQYAAGRIVEVEDEENNQRVEVDID